MPRLPNKEFKQLAMLLHSDEKIYEDIEPRSIVWPAYNLSQIEDAEETLAFIRESISTVDIPKFYGKVGRPLSNPRDLAKAVLACEALGLTERSAQGWLRILGPFLEIKESLDDRTIGDAYDKAEVLIILKQVFEEYKDSDGILCGDGTGLESSRKQNYESAKRFFEYMVSIVDSREVVQAFDIGERGECRSMLRLIKKVYGNSIRLDAGFNCRELVKEICDEGMIPYVFPKSNNVLNGSLAWKQMYMELLLDVMFWLTEYHLRSHSESFHSSFKRVYGQITKRRITAIIVQVTARIILHNRRRLSYFDKVSKNC